MALRVPEVVRLAIRAYEREASAESKHYAGVLVIARHYPAASRAYENALIRYNDHTDRAEGWKS